MDPAPWLVVSVRKGGISNRCTSLLITSAKTTLAVMNYVALRGGGYNMLGVFLLI